MAMLRDEIVLMTGTRAELEDDDEPINFPFKDSLDDLDSFKSDSAYSSRGLERAEDQTTPSGALSSESWREDRTSDEASRT